MKNTIRGLWATLALVGLTACGGTGGEPAADDSTPTPAATVEAPAVETETTEAAPEPMPEPTEDAQSQLAEFGTPYEYEDGVVVTVKHVGETVAGDYAAGAEPGASIMLFEVTVTNNTEGIMDAAEIHGIVNYDTTVAERVFDEGLDYTFQGNVLPGKAITEVQGYAIPTDAPQEVLFSVTPSWNHEEALFYGTISPAAV